LSDLFKRFSPLTHDPRTPAGPMASTILLAALLLSAPPSSSGLSVPARVQPRSALRRGGLVLLSTGHCPQAAGRLGGRPRPCRGGAAAGIGSAGAAAALFVAHRRVHRAEPGGAAAAAAGRDTGAWAWTCCCSGRRGASAVCPPSGAPARAGARRPSAGFAQPRGLESGRNVSA
jgi:hypothetical protein